MACPFAAQHVLAILGISGLRFRFSFHLSGDRDLIAFDRHLDVVLVHARDFGVDHVGAFALRDIDLDGYG